MLTLEGLSYRSRQSGSRKEADASIDDTFIEHLVSIRTFTCTIDIGGHEVGRLHIGLLFKLEYPSQLILTNYCVCLSS